ncbi:serine/threonine-protein kinase [Corallococcus sp. CA047B]|uniref:serine/threonine-protein kinase n=1 Tax=Corallococcus sp. CA047B TaxID=2316729 RepID=UPI00131577E3|nr:serine/threonine-protein kinase [Corallococcus sp. CA047B]
MRTKTDARSSAPVDPLLGTRMGEFLIEERIGEGGMGVVYRAVHSLIGKQAAIKVLRQELVSPQQVQRLLVEARAVNAIRHPGIIDIFGFGSLPDERPYVIMELLQGRPLSDFLGEKSRMDLESVVWVMDQVLAALGAAHRAGVVHRDLKPANVFVVETPEAPTTLKLVDFGIAKLLESRESPLTSDGSVIGTPEFMAPEQIRGGTPSPATDLYAVGVMLFQLLTGVRPFQGDSVQVMFAHLDRQPPVPSALTPGIPPEFDTLVRQLLAKDPADRPPSAEAVRERLKRVPLSAAPHPPSFSKDDMAQATASTSNKAFTPETLEALKAIRSPPGPGWWMAPVLILLCVGAGVFRLRQADAVAPARKEPQRIASNGSGAGTVHAELGNTGAPSPTPDELQPAVAQQSPLPSIGASTTPAEPISKGSPVTPANSHPEPPAPQPRTKDAQARQKLLQRVTRLSSELHRRSGKKAPPSGLKEGLVQLKRSAAVATTRQDCAYIDEALDSWEMRFNQQLPSP